MAARFCTSCGATLPEGAAFCTACGAAAAADVTESLPVQAGDPAVPATKRRVPPWGWAVIGVVALALVAGGAWALIARPWEPDAPVAGTPGVTGTASNEDVAEESEPVAEPEPIVSPYEGMPISTPGKGESDRTGLMEAARALTGTSDQFLVWQLYVQGDSAVGDIQEFKGEGRTPGRRWLVTWERVGGSWQGREYVPFLDAVQADVKAKSPFLSNGILGKVVFVVPVDLPKDARAAAQAAGESENGSFEIWVPTRLPEGYTLSEETYEPNMYSARWTSGSNEIGMVVGWGDGDLGGAEDLVTSPANWGPNDGWVLSSEEYGAMEIDGETTATSTVWGDVPEFVLRAIAMSMVEVSP